MNRKTWAAQSVDFGVGAISRVSDTDFRRAVSAPIVFSPQNPRVLYYGTQNVWESRDGGNQWQKISPDLTAHPGKPPLPNPEGVHHGDALVALSPSAVRAGVIWTGSNNGVLYLTEDGGKQWLDVTPPDMSMYGVINVQASQFNPSRPTRRCGMTPLEIIHRTSIRTRDFPAGHGKRIVTEPAYRSADRQLCASVAGKTIRNAVCLLFAATETSVHVSFDDGDHWQSLRLNLQRPHFMTLKIHDGDPDCLQPTGVEYGFWTIHRRSSN